MSVVLRLYVVIVVVVVVMLFLRFCCVDCSFICLPALADCVLCFEATKTEPKEEANLCRFFCSFVFKTKSII